MLYKKRLNLDNDSKFNVVSKTILFEIENNKELVLNEIQMVITISKLATHQYIAKRIHSKTCAFINNGDVIERYLGNYDVFSCKQIRNRLKQEVEDYESNKKIFEQAWLNNVFNLNKIPNDKNRIILKFLGATIQQKRWFNKINNGNILIISDDWNKEIEQKIERLIRNYNSKNIFIYILEEIKRPSY